MFWSGDAYDEPVQDHVTCRAILFPSNFLFAWYDEQFDAIVASALALGETTAYLSHSGGHEDAVPFEEGFHAIVQLRENGLQELEERLFELEGGHMAFIETAIYSREGHWGVLTTDDHSIVAGSTDFMTVLATKIDLDAGILPFLAFWKEAYENRGVDVDWTGRMLRHVYGDEEAIRYIADADFPFSCQDSGS